MDSRRDTIRGPSRPQLEVRELQGAKGQVRNEKETSDPLHAEDIPPPQRQDSTSRGSKQQEVYPKSTDGNHTTKETEYAIESL